MRSRAIEAWTRFPVGLIKPMSHVEMFSTIASGNAECGTAAFLHVN